jgi:uncharacterized membrane-anchored protein
MLKPALRILIVAALAALGLIGLVARESMARASGTEVLLAMEAVDPRALLSGHYVIVGLQELVPNGCPTPPSMDNDAANYRWLALRKSGATHALSGAGGTREEALAKGDVAVLGTAECTEAFRGDGETPQSATRLNIGIERFHIKQSEAQRIDELLRGQTAAETQRVFAIVSIGQDGRARLKGLQVDGERLDLGWL